MGVAEQELSGPDLADGLALSDLKEGEPVLGHRDGEPVVLVRLADGVSAIGATCTHYGGPLAEGLVVGDTIRCPWHHACFSLRTGEAVAAPALNPVARWDVEIRDGRVFVGSRHEELPLSSRGRTAQGPDPIVILGAGAAGSAAAETLRREGYTGRVVMVDPDEDAPYDRPNLSKDFLAGAAPEEWIPLRPAGFYAVNGIERLVDRAVSLDSGRRRISLESGEVVEYGALLIATGSEPRSLEIPGADRPHVHTLRSLADCRRIIELAGDAENVVVAGASFVGMEAAAALRTRGLEVTVVAPDEVPFERALGPDLGAVLWRAHEANGVKFRLGHTLAGIDTGHVLLDDDTVVPADLVVIGVGVRPATRLAETAGLIVDDGIVVDELLRTSEPGVYAAGDNARWPDPRSGRSVRVEHWVVAQRQGQAAARSILGRGAPYRDVPFFWTVSFGVTVSYAGHAAEWDRVVIDGAPDAGDASFLYTRQGQVLAVATIGRDRTSLEAELAMSRPIDAS